MLGTLHVNYEVDFNFKSTTEATNIIKKSQNFLTSSTQLYVNNLTN